MQTAAVLLAHIYAAPHLGGASSRPFSGSSCPRATRSKPRSTAARALRERIESLGVVPGQFVQLLALYEQDGLTQAELCAHVEIEQPTMARTLSRMQRDGLIDRVPDPADGRRSLVTLTPSGQHELVSAACAVNAAATQGLDEPAVIAFMATLATIIDNIEKLDDAR